MFKIKATLKARQQRSGGIDAKNFAAAFAAAGVEDEGYVSSFFKQLDMYGSAWVDYKEFAVYSALVGGSMRVQQRQRANDDSNRPARADSVLGMM
jgi:hypothetical protein